MSSAEQPGGGSSNTPESGPVVGAPLILKSLQSEVARLSAMSRWKRAFGEGNSETPLLVQRLDTNGLKTDRYYYIVGVRTQYGVTARFRFDAHSGEYSEAIATETLEETLPAYLTLSDVRSRLVTRLPYPDGSGVAIDPFPVWKPCRESFSPFLPFYLVYVQPNSPEFHRLDGKVFPALTFGAGL